MKEYLSLEALTDIIQTLEDEMTEQQSAFWFNDADKYSVLHSYDMAILNLKSIALLQFDVEI